MGDTVTLTKRTFRKKDFILLHIYDSKALARYFATLYKGSANSNYRQIRITQRGNQWLLWVCPLGGLKSEQKTNN